METLTLKNDIIKTFAEHIPRNPNLDYIWLDASTVDDIVKSFAVPRQQFLSWLECIVITYNTVEVTALNLNIRQAPNAFSKVIGKLYRGAKVTVDQDLNGWYSLAGGYGWVSKQYVK